MFSNLSPRMHQAARHVANMQPLSSTPPLLPCTGDPTTWADRWWVTFVCPISPNVSQVAHFNFRVWFSSHSRALMQWHGAQMKLRGGFEVLRVNIPEPQRACASRLERVEEKPLVWSAGESESEHERSCTAQRRRHWGKDRRQRWRWQRSTCRGSLWVWLGWHWGMSTSEGQCTLDILEIKPDSLDTSRGQMVNMLIKGCWGWNWQAGDLQWDAKHRVRWRKQFAEWSSRTHSRTLAYVSTHVLTIKRKKTLCNDEFKRIKTKCIQLVGHVETVVEAVCPWDGARVIFFSSSFHVIHGYANGYYETLHYTTTNTEKSPL